MTTRIAFIENGVRIGTMSVDNFMDNMGQQVFTCNPASGRYNVAPRDVVSRFNEQQTGDYHARLEFKGLDY